MTWLKRGLVKGSFGQGTDFLIRIESGIQAIEQPLLILIDSVCHFVLFFSKEENLIHLLRNEERSFLFPALERRFLRIG